jgi:hypothetical protein
MNDYEKTIAVLQDRVRALEERLTPCDGAVAEPKKWSPVGGDWWIKGEGDVVEALQSPLAKEFGAERPTPLQAERAAIEMRKFNRLLALRDELCGDDVPNWELKTSDKWRVYCDNKHGKWGVGKDRYMQDVGVYFTKEEHAKRACDMLNSGEVEL